MIDLELERKAFEKWYTDLRKFPDFVADSIFVRDSEDCRKYYNYNTQESFEIWQELQSEIDSLKACRSDFEIIEQTIALVDLLATSTNVYQRDPSCLYPFESENPRVKEWWRTACKIQELLTNTDPENCDFDEYKKMIEAAQENGDE